MRLRVGLALPGDAPPIPDALLTIADGRIERLEPFPAARPPSGTADAGGCLLTPGLVNAHCHLELTALADRIPPPHSFAEWLRQLVSLYPELTEDVRVEGIRRGLREHASAGTTTVLDIANTDLGHEALCDSGLRIHRLRELIGWRWMARRQAWRRVRGAMAEHPDTARVVGHLSPHAPYSAHPRLIERAARWARRHGRRWGIHLAESADEMEFLRAGAGPFREFLGDAFLGRRWQPPGKSALDYLASLGWPRDSPPLLFHANHLSNGELELAARLGVAVVHCPGSHLYFGREPFHAGAFFSRRIPLILGTDSRASNAALDMRREMRLFADRPGVSREDAFRAATLAPAAWLSPGPAGLAPGAPADFALWQTPDGALPREDDSLEWFLEHPDLSASTWVQGEPISFNR